MIINHDFSGDCVDGFNTYLNLEEHGDENSDGVLLYGINSTSNTKFKTIYQNCKRKILLDLWSPCALFSSDYHFRLYDWFDEIYSICPYTTKWSNDILKVNKCKYTFYPINLHNFESKNKNKLYDICFVGGVHSKEHDEAVSIISNFDKIFITQGNDTRATHRNINNIIKEQLISHCKIGLCYNMLYPSHYHLNKFLTYSNIRENIAFSSMDKLILPQIKNRIHEFALNKTLILCKRDEWNLIEHFYEPNKDFVYFEDNKTLKSSIQCILDNYSEYQTIIDSAYEKVKRYSTKNLVNMIKDKKEHCI